MNYNNIKDKILKETQEAKLSFKIIIDKPQEDMTTIDLYVNDKKAGYIIIGNEGFSFDPWAEIMDAKIIKKYRGQGYYKPLLKAAIAEAKKHKLKGLKVRSIDQTQDAKNAWKNIRYKEVDGTKYLEQI